MSACTLLSGAEHCVGVSLYMYLYTGTTTTTTTTASVIFELYGLQRTNEHFAS